LILFECVNFFTSL